MGPHTRAIAHARRRATVHTLGPVAQFVNYKFCVLMIWGVDVFC